MPMIRILLLLLLSTTLAAQPGRVFQTPEAPKDGVKPDKFNQNDILADTVDYKLYRYQQGRWYENPALRKALGSGEKGDKGDPGESIVGPAGPAGPQGEPGPAGPPGSGTGGGGYTIHNPYLIEHLSSIQVGGSSTALRADPTKYPGSPVVITASDFLDYANVQYAVYLGKLKRKKVELAGTIYFNDKGVDLGKDACRLLIEGNWCKIVVVGTAPLSVFGAGIPIDQPEADRMAAGRTFTMENMTIEMKAGQKGIEPGPSQLSRYTQIITSGGEYGMHLRFNLQTVIDQCIFSNCKKGLVFDNGIHPGSTNANSGSNVSKATGTQIYNSGNFIADVGIGIYASGGVTIDHAIIQGGKFIRGIDFHNKNSTVVQNVFISYIHFEPTAGWSTSTSGEAAIYIDGSAIMALVSYIRTHYGGVMINAGSTLGNTRVIVNHIHWWKASPDGKIFVNRGSVNWIINQSNNQLYKPSLSYFGGVAVKFGCDTTTQSNNRVCFYTLN